MGIFLKRNINDNSIVGLWEITETSDDLFSQIKLNLEEKELYESFRNDLRKRHWLSYRNLLMELVTPEEYSHVNYDEFGNLICNTTRIIFPYLIRENILRQS